MLIDTHCHLGMMVKKKSDTPITELELAALGPIIEQAQQEQVMVIITIGTNLIDSKNSITIAKRYPHVYATVGLHPNDCTAEWRTDLAAIKELLKQKEENKIVAIGECGLDFYWPHYNVKRQKDAFKAQIELALEHNLALTIHTRNAYEETILLLQEFKGQIKRGVLHCFSEESFAEQILNLGLLLGIGGIITYPKNEKLRTTIANTSLEKIVLETDSPFLPPQPIRGKQNRPQYISTIAQYIATLKGTPFEQVAQQTTKNAKKIFNLSL